MRASANELQTNHTPSELQKAVSGPPSGVQRYLKGGYSAISNAALDYWMPRLSGPAFKMLMLFLRLTIGDQSKRFRGDMTVAIPLDDITEMTGLDRKAAIGATRDVESNKIVSIQRAHRQTTAYTVDLRALLDPWVGNPHSTPTLECRIPTQETGLEWAIPTQNAQLEWGIPTPYKETNKAAAAAPSNSSKPNPEQLSTEDRSEIDRIAKSAGIRIDGKDALRLKCFVLEADLTLAHLRWFLADEKFNGARSPRAVLLTIAKEFRQRAEGVRWPDSFELHVAAETRGLTSQEILNL
jgi:hypothetical protein